MHYILQKETHSTFASQGSSSQERESHQKALAATAAAAAHTSFPCGRQKKCPCTRMTAEGVDGLARISIMRDERARERERAGAAVAAGRRGAAISGDALCY